MIRTSTKNDLIRLIYNETSDKETQDLELEVLLNSEVGAAFYEMQDLKRSMDKVAMEPSRRSIDNILNYSKSLSLPSMI